MGKSGPLGWGVRGGGGQNRFTRTSFSAFRGESYSKVSRRFSKGQKERVNFTFNGFLDRKFSSKYIMVPGDHEGVVQIRRFSWFYVELRDSQTPFAYVMYAEAPAGFRFGGGTF